MKLPFQLSDADRAGSLWPRLCARWEERIDQLHIELENEKNTEAETAALRGQIKALRQQLALNKELPPGFAAR